MKRKLLTALFLLSFLILAACASRELEVIAKVTSIKATLLPSLVTVEFEWIDYIDLAEESAGGLNESGFMTNFMLDQIKDLQVGDEITLKCRTTYLYNIDGKSCFLKEKAGY